MSGEHEWRIANLSAVRKIRSGSFQVGGYEWAMDLYPLQEKKYKEHMGLFLVLLTAHPPHLTGIKVRASFKIDDPSRKSPAVTHWFTHVYPVDGSRGWGFREFVTVASAKSSYVDGQDGSFTVQCQVTVTAESRASTAGAAMAVPVPPSNMAWHLEQLLATGDGADVRFLVEETEIHAHGPVIATRSPALHEAVESETGTDHVRIDGMRAAIFKAVLHFIYTDELPRMGDLVPAAAGGVDATTVAGEMLGAACRFRLERMKRLCENVLEKEVTAGNALATMKLAGRHHCPELEEYCIDYIAQPHVVKQVMKTFNSFLESQADC